MKVSESLQKSLENFEIIKLLGEGSFGKALLVRTKKGKVIKFNIKHIFNLFLKLNY